ncbi:MAG: transglycosylase domain-containing protein, partial [Nitrospiraceae bacterium]
LNVVEWGQDVYGAEAAARHHFGKAAEDLTPEEAALLAAILPAPRQHDPLEMTPYLSKRQQWVLNVMEKRYGITSVATPSGGRDSLPSETSLEPPPLIPPDVETQAGADVTREETPWPGSISPSQESLRLPGQSD